MATTKTIAPQAHQAPLAVWRSAHGMTQAQLAEASGAALREVQAAEEGTEGLVGELQDYLTDQGENVSELASEQSRFLSARQREK